MRSCETRRNPWSNRCVLMNGSIGKHIIGRPVRCDTVINTNTSRCVLRKNFKKQTPKKSKKTTEKKKSMKKKVLRKETQNKINAICLPKKFENLAQRCACNKKWIYRVSKNLGSGAHGKVYGACRSGDCEYAVKVQKYDKYAKAEIQAYLSLVGTHLTPKLYAAWICKGKAYIVLEKLVKCSKISLARLQTLLKKLEDQGWLHVDVHSGNIMCTTKRRMVLIDFGWAVKKGEFPFANHPNRTYEILKRIQIANVNRLHTNSSSS